jgi:choline/ethanolamine kinase
LIDDYNGDQVFCHNDLNANNIFYDEQLNQIFLIDFEFSGYNLKGFDIASYLNEMEYDYNYGSTPFF